MSSGSTISIKQADGSQHATPIENALSAAVPFVAFAQTGDTEEKILPDHLAAKASLGGIVGPDADFPIPQGAVHVVIPQITASRTWSLPDVDGYPYGQDLVIIDEKRITSPSLTLSLIPLAGSGDTIPPYGDNRILFDGSIPFVRLRRGLLDNIWSVV
ncbi:hypothetical protein [Methylobacterium sp. Gmos1]